VLFRSYTHNGGTGSGQGGAGYFGGGGGGLSSGAGGGGGGGSNYLDSSHGHVPGSGESLSGNAASAPATSDPHYPSGTGRGGIWEGSDAAGGAVVILAYIGAEPVAITAQPQSQSAAPGTTVALTVGYTGYPAPSLQWRKNGSAISGATAATLVFASVQSGDAGSYSVVLTGATGTVTSATASLTVTDAAPGAPGGLNYIERTATSVSLLWQPAQDDLGIGSYQVYRGGTLIGTTTDLVFADSGLTPNTAYSYTVKAVDTAGQLSAASNTLNVSTTQDFSADSDQDGIPNAVESALNTTNATSTAATPSQTQQVIHRPIQ